MLRKEREEKEGEEKEGDGCSKEITFELRRPDGKHGWRKSIQGWGSSKCKGPVTVWPVCKTEEARMSGFKGGGGKRERGG